MLAVVVDVGEHLLEPDQAGQQIQVLVRSTDPDNDPTVSGFLARVQSGDGTGPLPQPTFESFDLSGGIWDAHGSSVIGGVDGPEDEFVLADVVFSEAGSRTEPDGLLITLTVSTVGLESGTFDLLFSDSQIGEDSAFLDRGTDLIHPEIRNGSMTIRSNAPDVLLDDAVVTEGEGSASATVRLSEATNEDVVLTVTTASGTAVAPDDFTAKTAEVTIPAGETSASFNVAVSDDNTDESSEQFQVRVLNVVSGAVGDVQPSATVTIHDNDPAPDVAIIDTTVSEGDATAPVRIRLSGPSAADIRLTIETFNESATAGEDYVAKSEQVTIPAGETEMVWHVDLINDALDEPEQTFGVRVASVDAGDVGDASQPGRVTVVDDDGANTPPIARPDQFQVETTHVDYVLDTLANDSGQVTIDAINVEGLTGTVTMIAGGRALAYTPAPGFLGTESFQYTIRNDQDETSSAVATVNVVPEIEKDARISFMFTDLDGNQLSNIAVNEVFVLHAIVEDLRDPASGVFRFHADVFSDPSLAAVAGPLVFGPDYMHAQDGGLSFPGLIDEAGGHSTPIPLGPGTFELFSVPFRATQSGSLTFLSDAADRVDFNRVVLYEELYATPMERVSFEKASIHIASARPVAVPDVYTVGEDGSLVVPATNGVLVNDAPGDGQTLVARLVDGPAEGTLDFQPDGSFTYSPTGDFSGPVTFTYLANDGVLDSLPATVTIHVTPENDPPVAADDFFETDEDVTLQIEAPGILANDTDIDSDTLTAAFDSGPSHGILQLASDGSFVYTPDADFQGLDTFSYRASDGQPVNSESDLATVTISVHAVNDAPEAIDQRVETPEETEVEIVLQGNDGEPESDPRQSLQFIVTSLPGSGTLSLTPGGAPLNAAMLPVSLSGNRIYFQPAKDDTTSQSFEFHVIDDGGVERGGMDTSTEGTVSIDVTNINDPPVGNDDEYTVRINTPLTIAAAGVLANDTDPDGDALNAVLVDGPQHGELTLLSDGSFSYTPDPQFIGDDQFSYRASDGTATSATTTVALQVRDPMIEVHLYAVDEDGDPITSAVSGDSIRLRADVSDVTGPDAAGVFAFYFDVHFDPLLATAQGPIQFGDQFLSGHSGSFDTAGLLDEVGAIDDFAESGAGRKHLFSVAMELSGAGQVVFSGDSADLLPGHEALLFGSGTPVPPVLIDYVPFTLDVTQAVDAVDDPSDEGDPGLSVLEDTSDNRLNVLDNDIVDSRVTAQITAVTQPSDGRVEIAPDGQDVLFTPAADFWGDVSFTYTLTDSNGSADTATVRVTVENVDDGPRPFDDVFAVDEDSSDNLLNVLENDQHPDPGGKESLRITGVSSPSGGGIVAIDTDGTGLTYTPAPNAYEAETFTYTVRDEDGDTATATVTININEIPDPPTLEDDAFTVFVDGGETISLNVLANDSYAPDPPEDLFVVSATQPSEGSVKVRADGGSLLFTPPATAGDLVLTYDATDGEFTVTAEVTIHVRLRGQNYRGGDPSAHLDVNDDGFITPLDALLVINRINNVGPGPVPADLDPPPFYDTSGDHFITPQDALLVVNYLNHGPDAGEGEKSIFGADWPAGSLRELVSHAPLESRTPDVVEPSPAVAQDRLVTATGDDDGHELAVSLLPRAKVTVDEGTVDRIARSAAARDTGDESLLEQHDRALVELFSA